MITPRIEKEVRKAVREAFEPDRTYVNTHESLIFIRDNPQLFPVLSGRPDRVVKSDITLTLLRQGYEPTAKRHNRCGNRTFRRPENQVPILKEDGVTA